MPSLPFLKGIVMVQKRILRYGDKKSGTVFEHYYDDDEKKLHTRGKLVHGGLLDKALRIAHEMRQEEGKKSYKFLGTSDNLAGGKAVAVIPSFFFWVFPEIAKDTDALLDFIENKFPELKTTNAKL